MKKLKLKRILNALDKLDDMIINTPGKEFKRTGRPIIDALNKLDQTVFSFIRGGPKRRRLKKGKSFFSSLFYKLDYWFFRLLDRLDTKLLYKGRRVMTKSGLRVRSKVERRLAEMLDNHGITYRYEDSLTLAGIKLHPDFYLPKENVYIELWGLTRFAGYRKIKEKKEHLYKKHGIKVISVYLKDMDNIEGNFSRFYEDATGKKFPKRIC